MNPYITLKFRKERKGPELELVNAFLSSVSKIFSDDQLEVTSLIEPYAEVGIPDIVLILWDKHLCEKWLPERRSLNKTDIKILHHISTFGEKGVLKAKAIQGLGFEEGKFNSSTKRLRNAGLVHDDMNKVYIKDLEENFVIRKIITIEAKVKDWRTAIEQAKLNENFSSHSYVLLPKDKVRDNMLIHFSGNTGLLLQDEKQPIVKKKAKKNQLPGSYFSWMLNEYVGTCHIQNQANKLYEREFDKSEADR